MILSGHAEMLAGAEAVTYLRWLDAVAARKDHEAAHQIRALAAELERRIVLPGPDAVAVIEAHRWAGKENAA